PSRVPCGRVPARSGKGCAGSLQGHLGKRPATSHRLSHEGRRERTPPFAPVRCLRLFPKRRKGKNNVARRQNLRRFQESGRLSLARSRGGPSRREHWNQRNTRATH